MSEVRQQGPVPLLGSVTEETLRRLAHIFPPLVEGGADRFGLGQRRRHARLARRPAMGPSGQAVLDNRCAGRLTRRTVTPRTGAVAKPEAWACMHGIGCSRCARCLQVAARRLLGRRFKERGAGFVHDSLHGRGASAALRAAAERRVDLAHTRPLCGARHYRPHITIAKGIAGADDHRSSPQPANRTKVKIRRSADTAPLHAPTILKKSARDMSARPARREDAERGRMPVREWEKMDPLMAGSLDLDRIRIASRLFGGSRNCVPALKNSVGNAPSRPPSRGGGAGRRT